MPALLRSILFSICIISPSVLAAWYLQDNSVPLQYGYFVVCTIIMMAVLDFATVIFIEQYRSTLGRLTMPALLSSIALVFLFMVWESLNRFVEGLGYSFMTPLIVLGMLLIYAAVFAEKSVLLKSYLSINSVALALLWAMGAADKVTMPF